MKRSAIREIRLPGLRCASSGLQGPQRPTHHFFRTTRTTEVSLPLGASSRTVHFMDEMSERTGTYLQRVRDDAPSGKRIQTTKLPVNGFSPPIFHDPPDSLNGNHSRACTM